MKMWLIRAIALSLVLGASVPAQASQSSIVLPTSGPKSLGELIAQNINPALASLNSCHSGASAPANGPGGAPALGQCWFDTSASPDVALRYYDGAQWPVLARLNTSSHGWSFLSSSGVNAQTGTTYAAVDGDKGKLIDLCNASGVAVTLPQVGSGGGFTSGWYATFRNSCAGDVTITPTTSKIDDPGTSLLLKRYATTTIRSDGTNYVSTYRTLSFSNVGIDVQAYHANLAGLAGLTTAADKCTYWTGAGTAALMDCLSWSRSVTGAATAAAGRAAFGLAIGTDVQAYNSRLAGIAGLASTANRIYGADASGNAVLITLPAAGLALSSGAISLTNDLAALEALGSSGFAVRTNADTWAQRSLTQPAAGITITNNDGVSGNPTFALANDLSALEALSATGYPVRTASDTWAQRSFQAGTGLSVSNGDGVSGNTSYAISDAELLAIAGLTSAADKCTYWTGSGTAALADCPSYGRSLFAAVDAATARSTLGLGTAATQNTGTGGATVPLLSGNNVHSGSNDFAASLQLSGDISPTQITANQNDYAPTGHATASTFRLSSDASRNVTGLAGGADGRIVIIHNVGAQNVVLTNQDAASTAANRFLFGGDTTLGADTSITLRYDATASRWRAITTPGAGGGGGGVTSVTVAAGNGIAVSGTCTVTTSGTCTVSANSTVKPQGRLTLTSAMPYLASSVSAATTLYYTPAAGAVLPLWDGSNWTQLLFTELSIALGSNWASTTNYDVYAGLDSGTLRLCTGAAWTNSTTRAELHSRINGILLNTSSMTCRYNNTSTFSCASARCTYLGTVRTTAAGQVDFIYGAQGSAANLNVWNYYNRVSVQTTVSDSAGSWTYTTASARQANNSTVNQVNFVSGYAENTLVAQYRVTANTAASSGAFYEIGFGLDSTTSRQRSTGCQTPAAVALQCSSVAHGAIAPQIGSHYIAAIEYGNGSTATTFLGQAYSGLTVELMM